jgi:hypothetical protein
MSPGSRQAEEFIEDDGSAAGRLRQRRPADSLTGNIAQQRGSARQALPQTPSDVPQQLRRAQATALLNNSLQPSSEVCWGRHPSYQAPQIEVSMCIHQAGQNSGVAEV